MKVVSQTRSRFCALEYKPYHNYHFPSSLSTTQIKVHFVFVLARVTFALSALVAVKED